MSSAATSRRAHTRGAGCTHHCSLPSFRSLVCPTACVCLLNVLLIRITARRSRCVLLLLCRLLIACPLALGSIRLPPLSGRVRLKSALQATSQALASSARASQVVGCLRRFALTFCFVLCFASTCRSAGPPGERRVLRWPSTRPKVSWDFSEVLSGNPADLFSISKHLILRSTEVHLFCDNVPQVLSGSHSMFPRGTKLRDVWDGM